MAMSDGNENEDGNENGKSGRGNGGAAGLTDEEYWDARYRESDRVWSGAPNAVLVSEVSGMTPGRALDLGCGEGADAIWLARQGWRVTATDISQVALDRAAAHAAEAGVDEDAIDWQRHDLGRSFPAGTFDLASAHFLHSYGELPREQILRTAAAALAPGGVLLVVGHSGWPSWQTEPRAGIHFPTPDEVVARLQLADGQWELLVSEEYERSARGPEGQLGTRTDNTVQVRRLKA